MTDPAELARSGMTAIYLSWTAIHLLVLGGSFKRRAALMPALALPIDLAWDLFRAFSGLTPFPGLAPLDAAWPIFALANVWFVQRYARAEFLRGASERWFWPAFLAATGAWLALMAYFCSGVPFGPARLYTAFGPLVNLSWSLGFYLRRRAGGSADSLDLALWALRAFGTGAVSLALGWRLGAWFPLAAAAGVLAFEAAWLRAYLTRRRALVVAAS